MRAHLSSVWEAREVFLILHGCKAKRKIRVIPETPSTQESTATAK